MSAPSCKFCGHKKRVHNPQSENVDATLECEDPDCHGCPGYEPEDEGHTDGVDT